VVWLTRATVELLIAAGRRLPVTGRHSGAKRPMKARMTIHDKETFGALEVRIEIDEERQRNVLDLIALAWQTGRRAADGASRRIADLRSDSRPSGGPSA